MRNLYCMLLMGAALLLLTGVARSQTDGNDSTLAVRELWTVKSTDGRSHEIGAIALATSDNTDIVYVMEGVEEPRPTGSEDGEYLLWKLDGAGQVMHKEFVRKMPPRSRRTEPCATIVPLPAPEEGAIVIGMFDGEFVWSLLRVDGVGKIVKSTTLINQPNAFLTAILLPNAKGVLLAGALGKDGLVWKVDLDGKILWKKTYNHKAPTIFWDISLTDDSGGFLVAGDSGKRNKFGMGEASIWLVRCDEAGTVLSDATFPGRVPSICAVGKEQFAILYDAHFDWTMDSRVRLVNLQLKQQWEKKAQFTAVLGDGPAISSIPSGQGFVLAGCNMIIAKDKKSARRECQFYQYDTSGQIVSSASIPMPKRAKPHARVACGLHFAYVAARTTGIGRDEAREASIFEIPLLNVTGTAKKADPTIQEQLLPKVRAANASLEKPPRDTSPDGKTKADAKAKADDKTKADTDDKAGAGFRWYFYAWLALGFVVIAAIRPVLSYWKK